MEFKEGQTYKSRISNKNYKIHIVAVVDDCMVVYKFYGKHKQWWHYAIKRADDLEFYIELAEARKDT
tara:strand:- start:1179 stop:1379 length:201 start_codon:yes stop_codon:yes gene_type:complete